MAEAKQSYAQRMKAARAAARVKREAEKAAWLRQIELHAEVRRLSPEGVKAGIVARGDHALHLRAASRPGGRDGRALFARRKAIAVCRTSPLPPD
jgi:hypothetical protein